MKRLFFSILLRIPIFEQWYRTHCASWLQYGKHEEGHFISVSRTHSLFEPLDTAWRSKARIWLTGKASGYPFNRCSVLQVQNHVDRSRTYIVGKRL